MTRVDERVEPLNVEERTFRMEVVQRVWIWEMQRHPSARFLA